MASSSLVNHDGTSLNIRPALKVWISNEDKFEEHLMNANNMNLHIPLASENFICFVRMANRERLSFLNGIQGQHPTMQLVIVDMPQGLLVLGINEHLPLWNSYTTLPKFLMAIFSFVKMHLDNDGVLLLIHHIGLQGHLHAYLNRANMKV